MEEGSYRDTLNAQIAAAILGYLDEHPRLVSTEVEDVIPFETPSEVRKSVLFSLQKQGLIRLKGDRRTAYYEKVLRSKSVLKVVLTAQLIDLLNFTYNPAWTREILHRLKPELFPDPKDERRPIQPNLPF